jgi:hypothetical protein
MVYVHIIDIIISVIEISKEIEKAKDATRELDLLEIEGGF